MPYYPMHMHLHSIHQPGASMEGHIYNAYRLGMKYIRFTEHDTRTGRKKNAIDFFDFERQQLRYEDTPGNTVALDAVGEPALSFSDGALHLHSQGGEPVGVKLYSSAKRHTAALLSNIVLTLGLKFSKLDEGRIIIDITLSQRPPENKEAHMRYIIGEPCECSDPHTVERYLPVREDGIYTLRISDDAEDEEKIGGLDNVFSTLSVLTEGAAEAAIFKLEISSEHGFDELIKRQRALADKIGAKYGVKPFVTTEISGAGRHKNVFSERVPIISYNEHGYSVSEESAIEHVLRHGGIFSYNHPFEKYKRLELDEARRAEILKSETEAMLNSRAIGAAVLEVGFPGGRSGFTLKEHLALWDALSLGGVFITGDGDSDSHHSDRGWLSGNNFATWIYADGASGFPIPEEDFVRSLRSGNAYMADPTVISGGVSFTAGERPMGSVVVNDTDTERVSFTMEYLERGYTVVIIENGAEARRLTQTESGRFSVEYDAPRGEGVSFTRVEVYGVGGRSVLLTNPIYFVKTTYQGEIPKERL